MTTDSKPVIRLHVHRVQSVTVKEYAAIMKDLEFKLLLEGELSLGDRILAKLLLDNKHRYDELVAQQKET